MRRRGWAIDDREHEEDGRCVAVALPASRIPAAISVSAPAMRFGEDACESVAAALLDSVSELGESRPGAE